MVWWWIGIRKCNLKATIRNITWETCLKSHLSRWIKSQQNLEIQQQRQTCTLALPKLLRQMLVLCATTENRLGHKRRSTVSFNWRRIWLLLKGRIQRHIRMWRISTTFRTTRITILRCLSRWWFRRTMCARTKPPSTMPKTTRSNQTTTYGPTRMANAVNPCLFLTLVWISQQSSPSWCNLRICVWKVPKAPRK